MIDMKKYEALAKIDLPESERQWLAGRAEELIKSFSALESVDASGIEPLVTVLNTGNILRDDVAKKFITRGELLSNAPEQYDGYFQVPKTLD